MALRDAVARLQVHAGSLSGMKESPTDPPESANQYPFAVTYVRGGSWHVESAGFSHALVTFITEIHVNRQNLPTDVARVVGFFEGFMQKLLGDQTLNGNIDTISTVDFEFGSMVYSGVETLGWRFVIGESKVTITS